MGIVLDRLNNNQFVLIAEVGVNYYDIAKVNGLTPMEAAKLMIKKARLAGIHAVKFQTYKAETLVAKESPSYWDTTEENTTSQYELFKKFDAFGEKEYRELFQYCNEIGIEFMSTPFDIESADYLYDMMDFYKISSSDLNNLPFIEYMAKKNKPIILSVGASNYDEIRTAVCLIRKYNDKPLTLLHCVLEYPTPYEHANLNKIKTLRRDFPDCHIGYSDHTKPDGNYSVVITAYNYGAQVIEKHYTLDKTLKGNDHYHAMDEKDAMQILERINFVESISGDGDLVCLKSEAIARKNARRSVVCAKKIHKGEKITGDMLTFKRPGTGIMVSDFSKVLGMSAVVDIDEDTILQWSMIQ